MHQGQAFTSAELKLPLYLQVLLFLLSLFIVGFGQPALVSWSGLIAACLGFALFFRMLLGVERPLYRFYLGTAWFGLVQLIQLSWLISHPYLYIYFLYGLLVVGMGAQFGLISILITPFQLQRFSRLLVIAACWTLLEWSRLYLLSGFSWNPIGLALTGNLYALQFASIGGVYSLSFWVILVNLLGLRAWIYPYQGTWHTSRIIGFTLWAAAALMPYAYGYWQIQAHQQAFAARSEKQRVTALLVQTAFPVEESMDFKTPQDMVNFVYQEWSQVLHLLSKHKGKPVDMIIMPEYIVPFGTYFPVFRHDAVVKIFKEILGEDTVEKLPPLNHHFSYTVNSDKGATVMVNNAFWVQGITDIFDADVIVGLEDSEKLNGKETVSYSSAFHFIPNSESVERYEKRVLVPMGEYIPFAFCRNLAAQYGIQGSFTCGCDAKVMACRKLPIGASICYEETYGHLMRENRLQGAELLVNLTNDGWFPHSTLSSQHLEHARLRTVEMGIPLVRACNTGTTCVIDAFGRTVSVLGDEHGENDDLAEAMLVTIPTYTYETLYTHYGDFLILCLSVSILFLFAVAKFAAKIM